MLLICGLGNPGPQYAENRHNIGFHILEVLACALKTNNWRNRFSSMIAEARIHTNGSQVKILLLKPMTFYNEAGRAVAEATKFYKIPPENILVIHDEIDLAAGRVRIKTGGGHSGNNGVRSIINHIGQNFRRARIGIGHPGDKTKVKSYVLSDFAKSDYVWLDPLFEAFINAMPLFLDQDEERIQTEIMRLAPVPKSDPRKSSNP